MSLYAETSAILAWLLNEAAAAEIRRLCRRVPLVVTSVLTWVECDRALRRYGALGERTAVELHLAEQRMLQIAAAWTAFELDPLCLNRVRRTFPVEPVRTLDALHLSAALVARDEIPGLRMLSLDDRVRQNASALGFAVLP